MVIIICQENVVMDKIGKRVVLSGWKDKNTNWFHGYYDDDLCMDVPLSLAFKLVLFNLQ